MPKKTKTRRRIHKYCVWVEGKGRDYFGGLDRLEKALGKTGGSVWGPGGWDCAWYNLSKKKAQRLASRARRFKCVKSANVREED